jgi:cytochrome c553
VLALICSPCATALAQGVEAGAKAAQVCIPCHGPGGHSQQRAFPILAGQTAAYIVRQIEDFRAGRRKEAAMAPFAASLTAQERIDVAAYFAAQPRRRTLFAPDPEKAARGSEKAAEKACAMCHLQGFAGLDEIPRVAGQHYEYVAKQLRDFRETRRANDAGNMVPVVQDLSDAEIEDIAHYVAGLE